MTEQKEIAIDIPDNEDVGFCCSNTKFGLIRYLTMISVIVGVMLFCIIQLSLRPTNLEIRSNYLTLLSSCIFLLIPAPHHND